MSATLSIPAADLGGNTGQAFPDGDSFEGIEVLDFDDIVDRNERLELVQAYHQIAAYVASTSTSDGTVRGVLQVSASPSKLSAPPIGVGNETGDVDFATARTDSIDLLGRNLEAVGFAGFSDSGTGVGGAGTAGHDAVMLSGLPRPVNEFHPRDELFINGEIEVQNVADAAAHLDFQAQHLYGVVSET